MDAAPPSQGTRTMEIIEVVVEEGVSQGRGTMAAVATGLLVSSLLPSAIADLAFGNQVSTTDLASKSQVAHQDANNRMRQAILARAVTSVQSLPPVEARSDVFVFSSNEAAQDLLDLKSAVSALG